MSTEASLFPKYKTPEPLSSEEEAEELAAIKEAKSRTYAKAIKGAGGTVKLSHEGVKIEIESSTLHNFKKDRGKIGAQGECVCGETVRITKSDIETNGGRGGEHPLPGYFSETSSYQKSAEKFTKSFEKGTDTVGHIIALAQHTVRERVSSNLGTSRSMTGKHEETCPKCKRIHRFAVKYEATASYLQVEWDPLQIWRLKGFNLAKPETSLYLERFAARERFGLADEFINYLKKREVDILKAAKQATKIEEAVTAFDVRVDGNALRTLQQTVKRFSDGAAMAIEWESRDWLFSLVEDIEKGCDASPGSIKRFAKLRIPEWFAERWRG